MHPITKLLQGIKLTRDVEERVDNHLIYGSDHAHDGYDVMYGRSGTPELEVNFADATRSHLAAILRGEISPEDLWEDSLD